MAARPAPHRLLPGATRARTWSSDDSCGLTEANSKPHADPQLSPDLVDAGGDTDVLTIPAASPAVDIVASCFTVDQRGFDRGSPCDAGAYEQSAAVPTVITGGPSGATTNASPSFSFASDAGNTFECALSGPGFADDFAPCTSPASYSGLPPGDYVFTVRTLDSGGRPTGQADSRSFTVATPQQQPSPTPTPAPAPAPTATPTPVPVAGQTVVVAPVRGKVLVKKPGSNTFVEVDATQGIPLGSTIDTTHGTIELTSQKTGGKPQTALFYDGQFKITQTKATTDLTLNQPLAACPKRGKAAAAAKKPKTRKLWGNGHGSFRTTRPIQRRHRPRHQMARPGLLRRHAHAGRPGRRLRPRHRAPQDDHLAGRQEVPGPPRPLGVARTSHPG